MAAHDDADIREPFDLAALIAKITVVGIIGTIIYLWGKDQGWEPFLGILLLLVRLVFYFIGAVGWLLLLLVAAWYAIRDIMKERFPLWPLVFAAVVILVWLLAAPMLAWLSQFDFRPEGGNW